jgi:hypothetical protein
MAVTAQGATFTYTGTLPAGDAVLFVGKIVGISVETPQAEVVDMTGVFDPAHVSIQVPTGAWSGGAVRVDYLKAPGGADPQLGVRSYGNLTLSSPGHNVSKRVVCESASEEARVGDLVRGSITFRLTDY